MITLGIFFTTDAYICTNASIIKHSHCGSYDQECLYTYMLHTVYIYHYDDVIMSLMASQITSLTIIYSTSYSGVDQRKHQSSASLAFGRGIHRGPVNSPHKRQVTRKMFPFHDVIMCYRNPWYDTHICVTCLLRETIALQWLPSSCKRVDGLVTIRSHEFDMKHTLTMTCFWIMNKCGRSVVVAIDWAHNAILGVI